MITYCAHQSTAKVANREALAVVLLRKERLLGCDAVAVGESFIVFRRIIVPSFTAVISNLSRSLHPSYLKKYGLASLQNILN